jgi:hypothetical protein
MLKSHYSIYDEEVLSDQLVLWVAFTMKILQDNTGSFSGPRNVPGILRIRMRLRN